MITFSAVYVFYASYHHTTNAVYQQVIPNQPPAAHIPLFDQGVKEVAIEGNEVDSADRERVIFAHLHMAKTAGTYINAMLAHHYERVCGHKGYSYDAHQANQRHKAAGAGNVKKTDDSFKKLHRGMNRLRVPFNIMNEIGYEDCDWISLEESWLAWGRWVIDTFKGYNFTVEMHVPCRDPLKHLMSMTNHQKTTFDCNATDLEQEVDRCIMTPNRFNNKLLQTDGLTLRCFDAMPPDRYLDYMGNILQKKRIYGGEFANRSVNRPRDKSKECIWSDANAEVRQQVVQILRKNYEYHAWCAECMGSELDLFSNP